MVLAYYKAFQFWRYCSVTFPCKSFCLQVTGEVRIVTKSVQSILFLIFIELSKRANSFVEMYLVLEIKNVASFIKTGFYWKRGCVKLCKYGETFKAYKGYNLVMFVFLPTSSFSKQKLVVSFTNVHCKKTRTCTRLLFIWKWITSAMFFIWHEMNGKVLGL